jgi:hypothetical protein
MIEPPAAVGAFNALTMPSSESVTLEFSLWIKD